nr:hypothetical protein ANI_1_1116084 [Aspergillus niger CBS 513.88]|eukprot:XP_001393492.2 hypothetical protein ANI_1_1116084 [Aspergillus niger CBS 513.88]
MDTAALLNSVTWQNTLLFAGGAYIILNLKGLPFVWHVRLLNCLKEHIILNRARQVVITTHGPQSLFYPVITTSSTPLLEIDYNMHKSNATYFTDLDINRVHLISSLFKDQLALGFSGGELNIALGSTACVFKREIKPYQAYEIHTRLLSWDEKWVYFVSHFVKTGGKKDKGEKCILASAVTRYVFKNGRISVSPETVLSRAGLLPEKGVKMKEGFWSWEQVEEERKRGLEVAKSFLALDGLHAMFRGDGKAIGVF